VKISKNHSNRKLHNWLIYDINDQFLEKHAYLYKGDLYDLGAGEAPYKEFFLGHAKRYFAVDWSDSIHQTNSDMTADLNGPLPITTAIADTVIALSVLEHLREPQVMLCEAFRILKPGGHLLIQVPWQWQLHEVPHDYFRYTPFGLRYILEKAGFVNIEVEAQAGFFTMLVLKINYFSCRLVHGPVFQRKMTKALLTPFWFCGQLIAPWLDRFESNWERESTGYFVTARKPGPA
jgi:SAM-dependent methyltransferase